MQDLYEKITVRSRRQNARRARRAKAAEKAANSDINVKLVSFSKKNCSAVQEIDYSDPLHYLRVTTSTSKLFTANEELELSEGIQVSAADIAVKMSGVNKKGWKYISESKKKSAEAKKAEEL